MTLTDAQLDAALDAIRVEGPEPPPLLHEMENPMTPEVAKLVEAAKEYIDELEWHYGGGETDLGRKYRAALAALRAGGDPHEQWE